MQIWHVTLNNSLFERDDTLYELDKLQVVETTVRK